MTRIKASLPDGTPNPAYLEIDRHQRMLCLLINSHVHSNTVGMFDELPLPERVVLYSDIINGMFALFDDVPPSAFMELFGG